jgi:hypothetical protein
VAKGSSRPDGCDGVLQRFGDVPCFEVGVLAGDLLHGHALGDYADGGSHGDAKPTHAGDAAHRVGLESDSVEAHNRLGTSRTSHYEWR